MYESSKKLIQEIGFSTLHVFPYSERENTLAITYDGKVDPAEKKRRVRDLEKSEKASGKQIRDKYIGKEVRVLIEEKKNKGYYGYSENYLRVKVKDNIELDVNDEVDVKIVGQEKELLILSGVVKDKY